MPEYVRTAVDKLLYTPFGQILTSAIFGLAIALLFKRVCKDNCTEYHGPYVDDINDTVFKLEDTCYKYKPYMIKCNENQNIYTLYDVNTQPVNKLNKSPEIQSTITEN
jgi:hypothetical protein